MEANKEQLKIIHHNGLKNYVNAGAGCGKTWLCTLIIKLLNRNGVSSSNILFLAFNKHIVNSVKNKINHYAQVRTFHSLAYDIVRSYLKTSFSIMEDETEIKNTLIEIKKELGIKSIKHNQLFDLYSKGAENRDLFLKKTKYKKDFLKIYNQFVKYNRENKKFTYAELINYAIEILKNKQFTYPCNYKYIFVDEFQDCSQSRFELLQQFLRKDTYLLAVGDINQHIMGWAGNRNDALIRLKKLYKINYHSLTNTYRLPSQIAQASNLLLSKKFKLHSAKKTKGIVSLEAFTSSQEETIWVCKKIRRLIKKGKATPKDIVILVRQKNMINETLRKTKVTCLDIHQAKGLEFKYVFIIGAENGTFNRNQEDKRVLYVAMTRAKKGLYITYLDNVIRKFGSYKEKQVNLICWLKPLKNLLKHQKDK